MVPAERSDSRVRACEVLIVGGGPAGLFLAALLAQRGVDVVVLERRPGPSTHSRAIGLHPPALAALHRLRLDEAALAQGVPIRGGVARSQGRQLGELTFERAWSERPFVLALPQHHTEALLVRRLTELAPGALQRGWEVVQVHEDRTGVHATARRVTGDDGTDPAAGADTTWRARVLVGADGASSVIRDQAGIGTRVRPYPDTYLMGDFPDTTDDGATAAIYLEPGGVVESFPLPGAVRRWVAHTGATMVEPSPDELANIVAQRTGEALNTGSNTMISAFMVRRRMAEHMVTGHQVLIGDAAHEISPIGGQGMTLGWLDAQALVPLLSQLLAKDIHRPLQTLSSFQDFERDRIRAARRAARQAEWNMALGRPLPSALGWARSTAIRAVLGTPLRHQLAGAFTMRWA